MQGGREGESREKYYYTWDELNERDDMYVCKEAASARNDWWSR